MVWRIILTLLLIAALVLLLAIFGEETAFGIIIIFSILIAILFVVAAELVIGNLPTIRRINSLRGLWGEYNLDSSKLVTLHAQWNAARTTDHGALEPTRIRNFCTLQLDRLIDASDIQDARDRSRTIAELIRVVSYPQTRLTHITFELRLYALLLAATFVIQLLKDAPSVVTTLLSPHFLEGCRLIGEKPSEFVAGLELVLLAIFATRFLGELSNLRQYVRGGGHT